MILSFREREVIRIAINAARDGRPLYPAILTFAERARMDDDLAAVLRKLDET